MAADPNITIVAALTPEQALNNFKLLLELSERNTYEEYRLAVHQIATICLTLGIQSAPAPQALTDATDLLTEIMNDEVNHQDEAEKWLRAYAPHRLFPSTSSLKTEH